MRLRMATKLTLVVIPLVLVPLGGLAYVWYYNTKATLELQAQEELKARLRQVGLRLRPFLRERELDLYDLASSPPHPTTIRSASQSRRWHNRRHDSKRTSKALRRSPRAPTKPTSGRSSRASSIFLAAARSRAVG